MDSAMPAAKKLFLNTRPTARNTSIFWLAVRHPDFLSLMLALVTAAAFLPAAWNDFVPSAQGLEKEMQEMSAVLECTQLNFLPTAWRDKVAQPDGRARLQERLVAIRQLLRD